MNIYNYINDQMELNEGNYLCIFCFDFLKDFLNEEIKKKELSLGQNCIAPDCRGVLSNPLICKGHKTWWIYADENLQTQKKYDDSLTSRRQCLNNFYYTSEAIETECNICIILDRERVRSELIYCDTCGLFFDRVNNNFGFLQHWNDLPILFPHYNAFIRTLIENLLIFYENIEIERQITRENFSSIEINFLKAKLWIDENGYLTEEGEKEIPLKLYELQHPALESYLKQFSIKQERFVFDDSNWSADKPINISSITSLHEIKEKPIVFLDTQVLVGGIREKSLDRFSEIELGTEIDPELEKDNIYPLLLVCNASIKGYLNQLVVSEFIAHCFIESDEITAQKISLVYDMFTIFPFNPLLLKIGTVFSSTMRPYTKSVDIKDVYHYLFAKQNNVDLIVSEDKHYRYIKEFYERLKNKPVEIDTCIKHAHAFFKNHFSREANYYNQNSINAMFEDLFNPFQAIEILKPNSAKEKLREMINEEET